MLKASGLQLKNKLYKTLDYLSRDMFNIRVYNLIPVSQITRLLLEDEIISSKIESHNGSKKENRKKW